MAKVKIKADKHIHGKVRLHGDSLTAVFAVSYLLANFSFGKIRNVPRSKKFLNFIEFLQKKDVEINWIDGESIQVEGTSITKELALFEAEVQGEYILLLAAVLLSKQQSCVLSPKQRDVAKFYRELGFNVDSDNKDIVIRSERATSKSKVVDLQAVSYYKQMAAYLIQKTFSDFSIKLDGKFLAKVQFLEDLDHSTQKVRISNPFSSTEFNIFALLGATSVTGLEIEGFDQKAVMDQLIFFDETCADYEIKKHAKIWYSYADVKNNYDFSNVSINNIAYYLFVLSVYVKTSCKVIIKSTPVLQKVIKELNIIGCKINAEMSEAHDYTEITVNKAEIFPLKITINDTEWSGVLLAAAIISGGIVEIGSFELLENIIFDLRGKLASIGVEVS